MMHVFSFGRRAGNFNRNPSVHDIAEHILPAVTRRAHSDTRAMSASELRGYVRARAWDLVRAEVLHFIAEHRMPMVLENELMCAVLERIVHLAMREHRFAPVASLPEPHVRLRIAA